MLNKQNATIESVADKITADGRAYYELYITFDRSGKTSRIRLFDTQRETFQRNAERIYKNNNRCAIFYVGDFEKKDGHWVVWSGIKL